MATPYRISIGVDIDASGAKRGSAETRQEVSAIAAEAEKAAPKIEAVANAVQKLDGSASSGAAVASIDAIRASAVGAIPSMERLVNTFAGITAPAANDNGRVATLAAYAAELDRMQAKFDPVFAAQQRYEQNLSQINELERVGAITASAAIEARLREANAYDGLISKVERLAAARKAAAQEVVDRQTITPDRAADVEAYGRSLDQLRARYNPLYATVVQYKQAQVEIRNAHAVGAISADEMTEALSRQRQMTLRSIDVIKGRNKALADTPGVQGFQTANIAAQFQDIGVTAAMGMSPLQIALQQGTQLSSVLGTMGNGRQIVSGLAAAFTALVSPVSLATIGLVAAGAALIQYVSSASTVKTADDAIQSHADTIAAIKDAYGTASEALGDYVKRSQTEAAAAARANLKIQQDVAKEAATAFNSSLGVLQARTGGASDIATRFKPFTEAIREFRDNLADGDPDFVRFRSQIEAIVATDPDGLRKLADEIINNSTAAADADRRVRSAKDVIDGLGNIAQDQTAGVSALTSALNELAGIAVPALTNSDRALASYREAMKAAEGLEDRQAALKAYDEALRRIDNADPTVLNADGKRVGVPTPDDKPVRLGEAVSRSNTSAANSYRDLVKSADDRIAQMKLEAEMAGKVGIEADALRFQLDLLQRSEDKGRSISEKQREEINKKVEAFKAYAEAAATAKLRADLLWESEQAGRSWMEQQIAARQRSAGLDVDFDSVEADLIRMNLALEVSKSYAADFSDTLFDGLAKGEDLFDSLADAGISALKRLGKSLWDDVLNMLFSAQGGSGGGWLDGILSLFGGGKASADPWSGMRTVSASGATAGAGMASAAMRAVNVQPMLPASRSVDQVAQASAGAISRLKIELGLAADSDLNIRPQVVGVVQETAPDIAIDLIEQNNDGEAARVAQHNRNPRWR